MDASIHSRTEDGVRWCCNCGQLGQKSRLRKFQINFDECIWLCSHAKCLSEVENPSSSTVILKRKASEIPNLRKRRKTAQPVATATVKLANMHHFGSALLLQNEDALCWLDASILLLVFCESLRECLDDLPGDVSLKWLCREFDNAQKRFQAIYFSGVCVQDNDIRSRSTVISETVGKTSVKLKSSDCVTRNELMLIESANSLEDSLDLMKFLDEDTSVKVLPVTETDLDRTIVPVPEVPVGGNSPVTLPECQKSKVNSELSEPMSILKDMREKIWQELQPHLGCEKGKEETPVFALPVLLRHNKHFESHFETSYHWEFCCRACNFTETTVGKSVMPSLKTVTKPLNMTSPSILRPCYTCSAINQRSKLVIHSLPACPMFHFIEGIPAIQSWSQLNFIHGGYQYLLSAIIQYKQNPNHFVAWIKDNRRNLWLQGDDLKSPISHWSREEPTIPSSEVHVVLWERQGDCKDCSKLHTAAQCIIEADNLDLIKPFHRKEVFPGSLTSERCPSESVKMKPYLQTYIPKVGKSHSASASKEIVSASKEIVTVDKQEEKGKNKGNEKENNAKEKNQTKEKEKGDKGKSTIMWSERSKKIVGRESERLKCRQRIEAPVNSKTLHTDKLSPDQVLKSIPSQLSCKIRPLSSFDSGVTAPPQKAVKKVVGKPTNSKMAMRKELSSWLPKMKLVGNNLASKFAFLSESLPSCAEYRAKMARNRRRSELAGLSSSFKKSFDGSRGGSMRSLRLGSVSPISSPSGSSESCSLPDSAGSGPAFPELDDFLDEFLDKNVMPSEMEINGEMSPNFVEDFLQALDL